MSMLLSGVSLIAHRGERHVTLKPILPDCPAKVMYVSITHHRHVRIRTVVTKGMWAIKTARVHPAVRRVELNPIRRNSIVFGGLAALDYHPRIAMTSRHLVVRTLHHGRECMRDVMDGVNILVDPQNPLNVHVLTFEELYLRRAATLDIGVDDWTNVVHALQLDMTDLPKVFEMVSRALQEYVREFGTGTHGGQAGPGMSIIASLLTCLFIHADEQRP